MFRKALLCAGLLVSMSACAGVRAPIKTEAALGKVVVYRNGVAYFERRAVVSDGKLRITVPVDRVDDFLKSLKVVDAKTGESMPVAFDTKAAAAGETEMIVAVPGKAPRELLVSYVTDSPAWKPSYRIVLGKKPGQAELEAWAVVDNVSGEDWKRVTVGVGSTSALSFRYDLHSVRVVERETLGDEAALAHAPPTGGSPYAVASAEVPVVGELGGGLVDRLVGPGNEQREEAPQALASAESSKGRPRPSRAMRKMAGGEGDGAGFAVGAGGGHSPGPSPDDALDRLADQIKRQPGKVKLQSFAQASDKDASESALKRANAVRDRLIARGVDASKVDAEVASSASASQSIRVVAASDPEKPTQPGTPSAESRDPIGSSYFVSKTPMTIEKDRSAMVSLMKAVAKAERVYYYDPVSSRGSQDFAFQAVRIENPSEDTLDRGPFTVYAEGQFLGEGLSEAVPPKSAAFIPYALDRQIVVEPKLSGREEIDRLVTIERGIVTAVVQSVKKTTFSLHNRSDADARVFVRHRVEAGWELRPSGLALERLAGDYLFPVRVPARSAVEIGVEESRPEERTVDIRPPQGARSVGLYLQHAGSLPPALRAALEEVLGLYRDMADIEQRISTLGDQMNEYRQRVDEINVQLVTLRKVRTAQELGRHLAKKMQEMSERLQAATIRSTDLQEELMTRRIKAQDKLAELTLRRETPAPEKVAGK
jgi:hypothetical protein